MGRDGWNVAQSVSFFKSLNQISVAAKRERLVIPAPGRRHVRIRLHPIHQFGCKGINGAVDQFDSGVAMRYRMR